MRGRTDGKAHPAPVQMRRERDLAVPDPDLAVNSAVRRPGFAVRCGGADTTAKLFRSPAPGAQRPAIQLIRLSVARRRPRSHLHRIPRRPAGRTLRDHRRRPDRRLLRARRSHPGRRAPRSGPSPPLPAGAGRSRRGPGRRTIRPRPGRRTGPTDRAARQARPAVHPGPRDPVRCDPVRCDLPRCDLARSVPALHVPGQSDHRQGRPARLSRRARPGRA